MKRINTTLLLLAMALLVNAGDIQSTLLSLHKSGETMNCAFVETETLPKLNKETVKKGNLSYKSPDELRLDYTDPAGDYILFTASQFETKQGDQVKKMNVRDGKQRIGLLRSTLLYSLAGNVKAVAELNEAKVEEKETGSEYIFKLTPEKNSKHGISQLDLTYNKKTGRLVMLRLTKQNGNYTTYSVK